MVTSGVFQWFLKQALDILKKEYHATAIRSYPPDGLMGDEETCLLKTQENKMQKLNGWDLLAIVGIWGGGAAIAYFTHDTLVAIITLIPCYFLSKFIILKKGD